MGSNKYTREEAIEIVDILSKMSLSEDILDRYKGKAAWLFQTGRYDMFLNNIVLEHKGKGGSYYREVWKFLFEIPIKALPLLINTGNYLTVVEYDKNGYEFPIDVSKEGNIALRALVKLRLKWGK